MVSPNKMYENTDLLIGIDACYKVLDKANATPIIFRLDNEIWQLSALLELGRIILPPTYMEQTNTSQHIYDAAL